MAKFDDKVNGNTVDADEYNNIVRASKNTITDSGQSIDTSNTQLSTAVANYVASGDYYTDSGSANTYVLSNVGSFKTPNTYLDGMIVRFRAGNQSTAASTVNVGGLGVKNIKLADGTTDISTQITTTADTFLRFDSAGDEFHYLDNLLEIATQIESDAGTNDSKAITPLKLANQFKPTFRAYRSGSTQSITASVITLVQFNTESFDPQNEYDNTTNFRYTPQREGYYLINATVQFQDVSDVERLETIIRVNGSNYSRGMITGRAGIVQNLAVHHGDIVFLNGTTDYVDIAGLSTNSGNISIDSERTNFSAFFIGGQKDV
jgi:hypothetical protein